MVNLVGDPILAAYLVCFVHSFKRNDELSFIVIIGIIIMCPGSLIYNVNDKHMLLYKQQSQWVIIYHFF